METEAGRIRTTNRSVRREQVIDAAARLFSAQGYRATTLQDIMAAVGVSGAAFYYYFASKEDVLLSILNREVEKVEGALAGIERVPHASAAEKLRLAIAAHARIIAENASTSRVLFKELDDVSRPVSRPARARMRRYAAKLAALYVEGVDAGDLRPLDPSLAVSSLLGMANSIPSWFNPDQSTTSEVVALVETLATHGFMAGDGI